MSLCREYDIAELNQRIDNELSTTLRKQIDFESLLLAQEFSLQKFTTKCIEKLSKEKFAETKDHAKYSQLSVDNKLRIFQGYIDYLHSGIFSVASNLAIHTTFSECQCVDKNENEKGCPVCFSDAIDLINKNSRILYDLAKSGTIRRFKPY